MKIALSIVPTLQELKKRFADKAQKLDANIGLAIKKSVLTIEGEAKKFTPVDTGRLRASIYSTIYKLSATVQPKTNYALFVHEGTRHMKARPYMTQGAEASKEKIQQYFEEEINDALK